MFSLTGESGVVYQVDDAPFHAPDGQPRLYSCRDQSGRERIAKLYATPVADPQSIGGIRAAAARGGPVLAEAEAAGSVGERPDSAINLPVDVLADGPGVIGVILPYIPRPFLYEGRPRTFDELSVASAAPPDAGFRTGVMLWVCEIFNVLEGMGLVHGAVAQRNLLWRPEYPQAYLMECDGLRPSAPEITGDPGSDAFVDPRWSAQQIPGPDGYTDRYGLAVLMYRCLLLNPDAPAPAGGSWNPAVGVPADLDPRVRALFDRAFADPFATDARPSAAEWRDTLRAAFVLPDGQNNHAALAVLDRHGGHASQGQSAVLPGGLEPGMGMTPPPGYGPSPDAYGAPAGGYGGGPADPYGAAAAGGYGNAADPYGAPAGGYGGGPADPYGAPAGAYGGPSGPYGAPGDMNMSGAQPPYGSGPGGGPPPPYGPGPGGPPPPGGPQKRGMSPLAIAAIIAVPVLLIIVLVGSLLLFGPLHHVIAGPDSSPTPTPTDTYPSSTPTDPYSSPTPTDPYSSPSTSDDPYTPTPSREYHGAIAVAHDGSTGKSWDYPTTSAARARAMRECSGSGCKVLVTFTNGCGAVVFNSGTNKYWGGHGSTRSLAESAARSNAGGGRTVTWVCTRH